MGPLMAQASHAATAVLETHKDEEAVKLYLSDVPNMRKVRERRLEASDAALVAVWLTTMICFRAGGSPNTHRRITIRPLSSAGNSLTVDQALSLDGGAVSLPPQTGQSSIS